MVDCQDLNYPSLSRSAPLITCVVFHRNCLYYEQPSSWFYLPRWRKFVNIRLFWLRNYDVCSLRSPSYVEGSAIKIGIYGIFRSTESFSPFAFEHDRCSMKLTRDSREGVTTGRSSRFVQIIHAVFLRWTTSMYTYRGRRPSEGCIDRVLRTIRGREKRDGVETNDREIENAANDDDPASWLSAARNIYRGRLWILKGRSDANSAVR